MCRLLSSVFLLTIGALGCGSAESGGQPVSGTNVSLHVEGMMCVDSCAKRVEEILAAQPGVQAVVVDYEQEQATCRIDPRTFNSEAAVAELADKGFAATEQ